MKKSQGRFGSAVLVLAALAACKSGGNANAGDTTSPASAVASATPAPAALTDANILAKARIGDSAEVAIASYMSANTGNAAVKAYADLLARDHGKGMKDVDGTTASTAETPRLPGNDTTGQATSHVLDHLRALDGKDRDTAFVNHEIDDHKQDISDAKAMLAAAQKPEVKRMIEKELPELQKHLDRAQALTKQLTSTKTKAR